jgi:hypothetical protein
MPERNRQVAMMNKIYRSAQTVIVWLGRSDEHMERAIDAMNRLLSVLMEKHLVELPMDLELFEMYYVLGIPYIELLNGKAVGLSLGTNVPFGNPDSATFSS